MTTRKYDSSSRRAHAAATRRRVVESATERFLRDGYAGTSIRQIANDAGVSPETIYATFGSKVELLGRVIDRSVTGDDAPIPLVDRPWVRAIADGPDVATRIRLLAESGAVLTGRVAPLMDVVRSAARSDERIDALFDRLDDARRSDSEHLLTLLLGDHPLPSQTTFDEAVDWFHAITGDQLFTELVHRRGWTVDRYRSWLERTLRSMAGPD